MGQQTVLILDPDAGASGVLSTALSRKGAQCRTESDPAAALSLIGEGGVDLLISELVLPGVSSPQFLREAQAKDPDLAIIAVASAVDVNLAIEVMNSGVYNLLLKPFSLHDFTFNVEKALERRILLRENRLYQTDLERRIEEATSELKRANAELQATKDYLESLLDTSLDTIITSDMDYSVTYANRGAGEMLGHYWNGLVGRNLRDVIVGGPEELQRVSDQLDKGPIRNMEVTLRTADGRHLYVMASISRLLDGDGNVVSTLSICKDITQQKRLEHELKELTIRDPLTGLFNQRHFYQRLTAEIERCRRQNHALSLLLFDVDHFKTYNDTHGHLEGDNVLRTIGDVVREHTRDYVDVPCRYGGDEFVVILAEAGQAQARQIAERIRSAFEARHFGDCTLSAGVMTYRGDATAEEFIRIADQMMYEAKRSGGNRVFVREATAGSAKNKGNGDKA